MKFKTLCLLLLCLTSHAYASPSKLTDFDTIKNSFLTGSSIKMVVNLENNCKLLSDDTNGGPDTAPNTFGELLTYFIINYKTGHVQSGSNFINAPDEKYSGNYQNVEIDISPDNTLNLQLKMVTLPDYKVIKNTQWLCTIDNKNADGVKFFII